MPSRTDPARIPSSKIDFVVLDEIEKTLAFRLLYTDKASRPSVLRAIESCLTFCRSSYHSRAEAALGAQLRVELELMRRPARSLLGRLAVLWNQAADLGIKPTLTPEAEHELQSRINIATFVEQLRSINAALDDAIQSCSAKPTGDAAARRHLKGTLRKDVRNAIEGFFARTFAGPDSKRRASKAEFVEWAIEKIVKT